MSQHWLLTNTCYGNWLPGDRRGFVGQVREHRAGDRDHQPRVTHNATGTPYDGDLPGLERAARALLKGPPIRLATEHAVAALEQFQETARFREWTLLAVAIMFNHFHIVVQVEDDPSPSKILGDFKSWGTRRLSREFGAPPSETWWTERGSKRPLPNSAAVKSAVRYVLFDQPRPLVTWSPETGLHYGAPPQV